MDLGESGDEVGEKEKEGRWFHGGVTGEGNEMDVMRSLVARGCETLDTVHKTNILRRNNSIREEKSLYTQLNLYSHGFHCSRLYKFIDSWRNFRPVSFSTS